MKNSITIVTTLLVLALVGCGSNSDDDLRVDSASHWMLACDDSAPCGSTLACVCGVCTSPCESEDACAAGSAVCVDPATLEGGARCAGEPELPAGVCVPQCASDSACATFGADAECRAGVCLPPRPQPGADAGDADTGDAGDSGGPPQDTGDSETSDGGADVEEPCVEVWAPECGTDGVTYANGCYRERAGAELSHEGVCADCRTNDDCPGGEVCFPPTHACQPPCDISCLRADPVCGSDGVTYACGASEAWCHGATVAYEGECLDDSVPCTDGECGPAPGVPSYLCPDGATTAGPECSREGGLCGWRFTECPPIQGCFSDDGCDGDLVCNAMTLCLVDPDCPECDVCFGWCHHPDITCSRAECGPTAPTPQYYCDDRSLAGPICSRIGDRCGWTTVECP